MAGELLEERIPLFGELTIDLNEESKTCYKKLMEHKEIDRLKEKVMHLGILHEIGDVPSFGRWVHVVNMLNIIEVVKKTANTETLGFGNKSKVKLLNDAVFSSAEEFLKCWTMLYSIGHFVGTFTSEHAFLKSIIQNKKEFANCLNSRIDELSIKDTLQEIITKERVFSIFKIFTTFKILNIFNNNNKFVELAKLNLLEDSYLKSVNDARQRTKLWNLLYFFKLVRKLSFTILDGYFSHNCVVANHYYFLLHIDKILKERQYDQLLNNLNLFYTQTIYQSPEKMFYHHEFAKAIKEEVFDKEKAWDKLINDILNNEIDDKIRNTIEANRSKIKEKKVKHVGRITLKCIDKPVSLEEEIFKEISGGIIWNVPGKYYEVDFYSSNSVSSFKEILDILKSVKKIYDSVNNSEGTINNFEEVSKNILLNILKLIASESEFECDNRRFGFYSRLFDKSKLDKVLGLIEKLKDDKKMDESVKNEIETSKELLEEIVNDEVNKDYDTFIFAPNLISRKANSESECDFLLLAYSEPKKELKLHISEIKKSSGRYRFNKKQIQKLLVQFLGIDKKTSRSLSNELKKNKKFKRDIDNSINLEGNIESNRLLLKMTIKL
ncbi:MAG: hypothetical protein QFX36_03100 [Archaeoglobales archaeon]|nr:hypothetical protein [Archaeoglobales archaeon]